MLKFNIQNLKRDFQHIVDGVEDYSDFAYTDKQTSCTNMAVMKQENSAPQIKKLRRDVVLVNSDFNDDRVKSNPTGIIVSDRPSSQQQCHTPRVNQLGVSQRVSRSVYRSHKKRLMSRRESGDGAPAESLPNRHQRRSGSYVPVSSIVSPMRRLPIKDQLKDFTSPFTCAPSNSIPRFHSLERNIPVSNFADMPRPSPEGLVSEQVNTPKPQKNLYNSNGHTKSANKKDHKCYNRAKKIFPKTPKSAKYLSQQLGTFNEEQLMKIRNYAQHLKNLPCNHELYQFNTESRYQPTDNITKNTTVKDINELSTISKTSYHEQPSNANIKEQLQGTFSFNYPLHSTMSYPLHSTMQNANLDLDLSDLSDNGDMGCINKDNNKQDNVNTSDHSNGKSSSGVSLSDSDKQSSPVQQQLKQQGNPTFVSLSATEGVNMDKFSYDEGIMSESDSDDSFFGLKVRGPATPTDVKKYYTLSHTPEQEDESSDCESSILSINVDKTTTPKQHLCQDNNIVTCRCHVHKVHRIRRQAAFSDKHCQRDFVESTLFMDSQDGDLPSMEVDHSTKTMRKSTVSSVSQYNLYQEHHKRGIKKSSSSRAQNRINAESLMSTTVDATIATDMRSRFCHSIESMSSVNPLISEDVCLAPQKSNKVVVKAMPTDTNCLNLGKLLKNKDNSADLVENTIINHTLANPNVTMVAKGCLGFLKKKNKLSKKSHSKQESKKSVDQFIDDEDKENSNGIKYNSVRCKNTSTSPSNSSYASGMDKHTKRKLSKRMKDFRETTFSDPRKMLYQTMGHI